MQKKGGVFDSPFFLRNRKLKKFECLMCGWIYDEALGVPEEGIAPGTAWEDIPEDWACPVCGSSKKDFEMIEIQ